MFTIGFRGCDFHEKDACGSAGSASLTGSGLSAGSSQAVPFLNETFCIMEAKKLLRHNFPNSRQSAG